MSRFFRQAGWCLVLLAGWFCQPGNASAQGYRPFSPAYVNPYGNAYYPGYFNSYRGGYTYSPGALAIAYYPLNYTGPNGTAIPTYPPSINYPAFYIPNYNFLYNPALSVQVPTYPPSINYPAYSNPAQYTGNYAGLPTVNYNYQAAAYPATDGTGYYGTSAYGPAAPTIFPLMSGTNMAYSLISYNSGNWLDTHELAPSSSGSGNTPVALTSANSDRRVSRSNRPTAFIDLQVPPEAEVWFQGVKTRQKGGLRRFVSPSLPRGQAFAYDIRVRWIANGKPVTRERRLTIRRGDWWRLDMNTTHTQLISIPLQTAAR